MLFKHKQFPLTLSFIVWFLCVGYFWIFVHGDTFGYGILVFFLILPLTALITSLMMGLHRHWDSRTWCFLLIPAAGHLLTDYFTFKLANNLATHKLNAPDWSLLLPGLVCGLIGMAIGQHAAHRTRSHG